ncbi:hypothetical protein FQA39_LY10805 [Lamprigera yunnana]|nr:hypothetical protein FQA39_LY10805 [Lamprigera yunnana]
MEKFKRHGDGESSEWPERKKRKQKKSNVIKITKIKGEEHVNHVGKLVNKRQTGKDCRLLLYDNIIAHLSVIPLLESLYSDNGCCTWDLIAWLGSTPARSNAGY